jgi:hypothetical protein
MVKKPENVTQLRSFLGLVQYYGKFLQNLATEARPLNELLEKTRKWRPKNDRSWVTFSGFFTFKIASILSCDIFSPSEPIS